MSIVLCRLVMMVWTDTLLFMISQTERALRYVKFVFFLLVIIFITDVLIIILREIMCDIYNFILFKSHEIPLLFFMTTRVET